MDSHKTSKTKKERPSAKNVHYVEFAKTENETPDKKPFEALAKTLEDKLNSIEGDLKDSLHVLESEIQHIIKGHKHQSDFHDDINHLAEILETRVNNSLEKLIEAPQNRYNKEELKFVQSLSDNLVKILSFDFYKNVITRIKSEDPLIEVDDFGMDPQVIQQIKPFFDFLYHKYWRIKTTGIENIPDKGRALIVANHSGTIPYDGAMLGCSIYNEHPTRKDARFLVEDFVYHMPFLGTLMNRIGGVRACPENAERLLKDDHLVIVFPEGVKGIGKYYSQRYNLQRFGRGGFIKLCISTKTPLIPVGILGAEEIHPIIFKSNMLAKTIGIPYIPITPTFPLLGLLGLIPFPSKWAIHFGEPIKHNRYPAKTLQDELTIHKLSENVRHEIQSILHLLLKKRDSVWLG